MDLNEEFLQSLDKAFRSDRQDVRAQAHGVLLDLAQRDPNALLAFAVGAFGSAKLPAGLRALSATFLGGMLMPRELESRQSIWPQLTAASKDTVKEACLKQLIDPDLAVMRAAAALVAVVFALDCVSDKSWDQLLPGLTLNVENSDVRIQKAAVTSLGNICDLLNKHHINDLDEGRVDLLLTGICKGLGSYNELTETAVQAFDDSLQFLRKKLDNAAIADFVMDLLVNILRATQQAPGGAEAERRLVHCLAKIVKMVAPRLERYHSVVFDAVLASYARREPSVAVACNFFFAAMVRLDERRRTAFMANHWKGVMEQCLKRLAESEEVAEDDEGSGSSVLLSVLDTMTAVNRVYAEATVEVVKAFIASYIELPADDRKIVALVAFESLLEVPKSEPLLAFVDSGFHGILHFLQNGSPPIRRAASRLMGKLIRQMPEVFFIDGNFHKAVKILLRVMEAGDGSDLAVHLQYSTAMMLSELTASAKSLPAGVALLRSITDQLFDLICAVALSSDNITVIDSYFSVVFDFLQRVVDVKYLGDYLLSFVKYLQSVRESRHAHRLYIYEFLFINLTVIITQIKKAGVRFFANSAKEPGLFLRELYQTVVELLREAGKPVAEGLMLLATILAHEPEWGRAQLPGFLREHAFPALRDYQVTDMFKAATEALSLCCKTFEGEVEPFVGEIYPYFISLLANDLVQRELKISLFFALSDFVLHCQALSLSHLPDVLRLAELALDAVVHFQASDQEEMQEYAEVFKDALIDFYLCLVNGVYASSAACEGQVEASMRKVFDFVRKTNTVELNPTINYQNNCLGLLVDFYAKKKTPQLVDAELVSALFASLQKHANYADVGGTLDYARKHFSTL